MGAKESDERRRSCTGHLSPSPPLSIHCSYGGYLSSERIGVPDKLKSLEKFDWNLAQRSPLELLYITANAPTLMSRKSENVTRSPEYSAVLFMQQAVKEEGEREKSYLLSQGSE